jgi:hypothetical protein
MNAAESRTVQLQMDVDGGRIVFEALGEMPFKLVYTLIGKLNRQANRSLARSGNRAACYYLSPDELGLIVKALGELPFQRVFRLLESINTQIGDQMSHRVCHE